MKWYALIFAAIVIEGLITYIKTLVVDRRFQWQIFVAMVLGIVCAVAFNIDLFALGGIESTIPYIGMVLTGILLSRGSNYVFDLIGKLTSAEVEAHFEPVKFPHENAEG